jgi:UDP-2-acetamido-3-amino-2,3-dideoxy-glucuronate N-acetyltransferase
MKIIEFKSFEDDRGSLLPIEFEDLPFIPKRVFLINNVPVESIRGNHAHYETEQFLFCVNGSIEVILNNGESENCFIINKNQGVLVPKLIWDSQKFLYPNSTLLVLCSTKYDDRDYIFDFNLFKSLKFSK